MALLIVDNLKTWYRTHGGAPVHAVDGVGFSLEKGTSLGIAGESGCGKSTLAMTIMRLIKGPCTITGAVVLNDRSLLELPVAQLRDIRWAQYALISQGAMNAFNPVYRIGDQIVEAILRHRTIKKKEAWAMAQRLLAEVEIDRPAIHNYPHELSGGMRQRAMIAMALALDPDLIIADEPTTALDVVTQAQIIRLLKRLQREKKISIIYISHDLSILGQACDRIMIMYAGMIVEMGEVNTLFRMPLHPYTQALIQCFPDIRQRRKVLPALQGSPPDLVDPPQGCRFHPRCSRASVLCTTKQPGFTWMEKDHGIACHERTGSAHG